MESHNVNIANGETECPDFCEGRPMSAVGIALDEDSEHESVEVLDEGYPCPNEPIGLFRTHVQYAGEDTLAFWFCAECRDANADGIIEEVSEDVEE